MNVLSFQSSVVYGHVGNCAATLPLQRLGHEVWALDTVRLAHHPAHGAFRGRVTDEAELAEQLAALDALGALARCGAVISGYLGAAENGAVALDAVRRVKARNSRALYALDPVMGERGRGFYVRAGIMEFFRDRALAMADIVLPNVFELEQLSGRPCASREDALAAARRLLRSGPRLVVVKGIETARGLGVLAVERHRAWFGETPRLDLPAHGAGDTFAAFFLGHYLRGAPPGRALSRALGAQYALMRASARRGGAGDLALVETQDEWMRPKTLFRARALG